MKKYKLMKEIEVSRLFINEKTHGASRCDHRTRANLSRIQIYDLNISFCRYRNNLKMPKLRFGVSDVGTMQNRSRFPLFRIQAKPYII